MYCTDYSVLFWMIFVVGSCMCDSSVSYSGLDSGCLDVFLLQGSYMCDPSISYSGLVLDNFCHKSETSITDRRITHIHDPSDERHLYKTRVTERSLTHLRPQLSSEGSCTVCACPTILACIYVCDQYWTTRPGLLFSYICMQLCARCL